MYPFEKEKKSYFKNSATKIAIVLVASVLAPRLDDRDIYV